MSNGTLRVTILVPPKSSMFLRENPFKYYLSKCKFHVECAEPIIAHYGYRNASSIHSKISQDLNILLQAGAKV